MLLPVTCATEATRQQLGAAAIYIAYTNTASWAMPVDCPDNDSSPCTMQPFYIPCTNCE